MDDVTLILIALVFGTVAGRVVLIYFRRLAKKRGERYFPKYAKYAYLIYTGIYLLLFLFLYLLEKFPTSN